MEAVAFGHFAELIGDDFHVDLGEGPGVDLTLTNAERAKGERVDNAFSLLFRGPSEPFLVQRIYDVEHSTLGRLPIFLVPVGEEGGGYLYEAVFTRMEGTGGG